MYKVNLGFVLSASPVEWQNFIQDIEHLFEENMDSSRHSIIINEVLQPYHAFFYISDECKVDFESETDYALFLLRYGD
jgi:hypothetical protein